MEQKFVKVSFDLELAKKITNGEVDGRIVTRDGKSVRIICFDKKGDNLSIIALIEISHEVEDYFSFDIKGNYDTYENNSKDLFIEIPEYMTFKDGDILTYWPNENRWCIFIYKCNDIGLMHNYVTYDCDSKGNNILTFGKSSYISTLCKLSTEPEKQKLIDALKASKEPKAKEYLKRFFGIKKKKEYKFKPFDKVLGRECETDKWRADLFSHMNEEGDFICIGYIWEQCIPYNEETAHLLGTTEKYE